MHYAKYRRGSKWPPPRPKRQRFPLEPWRFREARLSVGLGVDRCADLLRVSPRTVRNWEAGTARVPYAAYKLMRVMRGGKLLGPDWKGFHVWHDTLVTPEGHRFRFSDLAWWSLLVRQAREWQRGVAERQPDGLPLAARAPALALGLVPSETSRKPEGLGSQKQGVLVDYPRLALWESVPQMQRGGPDGKATVGPQPAAASASRAGVTA